MAAVTNVGQIIASLVLLIVFPSAMAFYSSTDDVLTLDDKNFSMNVLRCSDFWTVMFYAPWCEHSKKLVPEYKTVARALKGIIKVGAINVDALKPFRIKFHITGYPSIKLFGANKTSPTEYHGPRKANNIVDSVIDEVRILALGRVFGGI